MIFIQHVKQFFLWEDRLNNVSFQSFKTLIIKLNKGYGYEYEHVIDDLAFEIYRLLLLMMKMMFVVYIVL